VCHVDPFVQAAQDRVNSFSLCVCVTVYGPTHAVSIQPTVKSWSVPPWNYNRKFCCLYRAVSLRHMTRCCRSQHSTVTFIGGIHCHLYSGSLGIMFYSFRSIPLGWFATGSVCLCDWVNCQDGYFNNDQLLVYRSFCFLLALCDFIV